MLDHLRPLARLSAIVLVFAVSPALAGGIGGGPHPGPKIISIPKHMGGGRHMTAFHGRQWQGRKGHRRLDRGLFFGDGDTGLVPYPAGADGDGSAIDGAPIVIDAAPCNRPAPNLGPQIITIPDSMRPKGGYRHAGKHSKAWTAYGNDHRTWGLNVFRHRRHARAWSAWPSYAYELSPIALQPCSETDFAPSYNTPCGVHPYE